MTDYLAYVRKHGNLIRAWQAIKANGRRSSSPYVVDDIQKFSQDEQTNIRSVSSKIQHGSYKFSPARGVALEKPNKPGSIRPIVIPRATDRVVQRCILDALVSDPILRERAFQPLSFGGVPKAQNSNLAGVPAAISAALELIQKGGTHIVIADISSFFANIRKSDSVNEITKFTSDEKFLDLFKRAIDIDLDNCESLWKYKDSFPYGDIGVGQGVCLSPFLGNLVLSDFDKQMNDSDCHCIRYVDDILIIAPSGKAASSRFRLAKKLLAEKGMEFSADKSFQEPRPVTQRFEYLGIDFHKGRLRPAEKSRKSIIRRSQDVAAKSLHALKSAKTMPDFSQEYSIPKTLQRISGMSRGWANHYRFCNDIETIRNVDRNICSIFLEYTEKSTLLIKQKIDSGKSDLASAFLGYQGMAQIEFSPFDWTGDPVPNSART